MPEDKETYDQDQEPRQALRQRTYIGAKILVDKNSTFNCVIKTRSENGFGLKLGSTAGIPDQFSLLDEASGLTHECQVVWRKRDSLGVKVVDESL